MQWVGKALKPGGPLAGAMRKQGHRKLIDLAHTDAITWRVAERTDHPLMSAAASVEEPELATTGHNAAEHEEVIRNYWEYTVGEVIEKHGTLPAFADLLKAVDKVEAIHMRRMDADRKTGELISRDFVRRHIMGLIERVFQRLLTDLPSTLAGEVFAMCESGATREALQEEIHDMISRELRTVKKDTRGAIRRAK